MGTFKLEIDFQVTETRLYGNSHSNKRTLILNARIDFLIATKIFDAFLF